MEDYTLSDLHIPKIDNIVNEENPFFGYVSSLEKALELVRDFENATTTKFTVFTKTKSFGATGKMRFEREYLKYSTVMMQSSHIIKYLF